MSSKPKYYAGIGSRNTPPVVGLLMKKLAVILAHQGYILRSGAAKGADNFFEQGCLAANGPKDIYLPFPNFSGHPSRLNVVGRSALDLSAKFHPAWHKCDLNARKLHARNAYQVLGTDLQTKAIMVVCWTKDGCISGKTRSYDTGGTGQAISIATEYNIPVYNLARPDHWAKLEAYVNKHINLWEKIDFSAHIPHQVAVTTTFKPSL